MPTLTQRLAAAATILLALAIAAVLLLRSLGVPLALGPLATAAPSLAEPTPLASDGGDPGAAFSRIESQVRAIRGLAAPDIGPPDILSRDQLAAELRRIFEAEYPADEQAADNAVLRALGLLGADQDIGALTEQLYAAQVLGFYDFDRKQMVVVSDSGLDAQAQITYAHEYTHALQDAAFDTGAAHRALVGDDDVALALTGLEEGDASLAMVLWGLANLTPDELLGVSQTPIPDMTGIPAWMVAQLELPYLKGAEFVGQLYAQGGWDAVDAAYADPPASTEQLLHPEKYAANESPDEVPAVDLVSLLGAAEGETWEQTETTTLGEAMVAIWLAGIGAAQDDADGAAAGWGGDRLTLATGSNGDWILALDITWDAPAQADEFEVTYGAASAGLPMPTREVRQGPTETLVLQASNADLFNRVTGVTPG